MSGYETYRESEIALADSVKLVEILYQGALDSVRKARRDLATGNIEPRGRAASKASAILMELTAVLDFDRGGQIARNLAALYDYMLTRLTEGHAKASDPPFAEVERLLAGLAAAWATCRPASDLPAEVLPSVDGEHHHLSCSF